MVIKAKPLPNRLKVLRAERAVTQFALYDAAKIGPGRYWQIEAGRTTPTEAEMKRLSRVLGVPAGDIFPGHGATS